MGMILEDENKMDFREISCEVANCIEGDYYLSSTAPGSGVSSVKYFRFCCSHLTVWPAILHENQSLNPEKCSYPSYQHC
jgi:hypothetical protein